MKNIQVKCCEECPCRVERESHGPCDSYYWTECKLTGKIIDGDDYWEESKWSYSKKIGGLGRDFPPSCPLQDKKKKHLKRS